MSEYSTDELVRFIAESKIDVTDDRCFAIIARLQVGDVGIKFIEHIQAHLKPGQEVICKICGKSAKAIAEYEGSHD